MGHGLVLTYDPDLDASVRALWRRIERAGHGVTPGQLNEPPHVTLADSAAGSPEELWEASRELHPADTRLTLLPFGVFPGTTLVVYYSMALCEELHRGYLTYYESLRDRGIDFNPRYSPANMIFHCTIATDVEHSALPDVVDLILRESRPLQGSAVAIELWRYFPVRRLERRSLQKRTR